MWPCAPTGWWRSCSCSSAGRVTRPEVAEELEISERTARRDLDAFGIAGLPVYSIQGRNGGWELLGGGTTDLTGLTAAEVQALFLVAGSVPNGMGGPAAVAAGQGGAAQAGARAARVVPHPGGDGVVGDRRRSRRVGTDGSRAGLRHRISTRCSER